MIISKLTTTVRCDMGGCDEIATHSFSKGGDLRTQLNLCEHCLREMYESIAKLIVPKGINNMLSKKRKKGEENNNEETVL